MRKFVITTTDGRQFPVSAFTRARAVALVMRATDGRATVESVREVR